MESTGDFYTTFDDLVNKRFACIATIFLDTNLHKFISL